ncbi:MAG: 50S ribosomal protein L6 [Rhodospirillales bacterium RIFCSPLOWO2_12_FULL_58_28]|nr:MAG: 50S ribosomal protein L6 [Rhodospirillales bacterium RIFCSPLOWO2_02_FULL_58_16]OHC79713.1 MAG: 50S ribosomal protein L6 [Rhodospirillales bacterium RIFCSPLOWO2_12_FULL_58_28]
MSRIGKYPVEVPGNVSIAVSGQTVTAKGKLGERSMTLMDEVEVKHAGNLITISPRGDSKRARMMWGTARSVINNMVRGVGEGFVRKLAITGVGYRAQVQGKDLVLQLGYSHEVRYPIPHGVTIVCPDQTHIEVSGIDKRLVGQTSSEIRAFRPPEPYKGKGVKYEDEFILRKEGKKK